MFVTEGSDLLEILSIHLLKVMVGLKVPVAQSLKNLKQLNQKQTNKIQV